MRWGWRRGRRRFMCLGGCRIEWGEGGGICRARRGVWEKGKLHKIHDDSRTSIRSQVILEIVVYLSL